MGNRFIQLLLGLSLLLNAFVLAGFIYRSWISPPSFHAMPPMPPPPPGPRPSPVELLAQDLHLDDKQRAALRDLMETYGAARRERLHQIQRLRDETSVELRAPTFNMTRIENLVDEVSRLRADQQKENLRAMARFEPALSPEQRERLHTILADRYANPMPPRPRQPGGPPPGGAAHGGPPPGEPPPSE